MRRIILHVALVVTAVIMVVPLVWLVAASTKNPDIFFNKTFFDSRAVVDIGYMGIPYFSFFDDFSRLFDTENLPFKRYLINSIFVTGATVLIQLFLASLGGFALAKYDFKGKRLIMVIMLGTMMIPPQVMLAPLYELIYKMGLMDSYAGLIVPGMVSMFGMFLFRQAMLQIPDELLEAGRIDGCTEFRLYWTLVMPITRPMTGAFCLIAFMGTWNSFIWPQIILQTQERFTMPIALSQMVGVYEQDFGLLMAGTLLSILPVIFLFFILQREFISGLTSGAVKG